MLRSCGCDRILFSVFLRTGPCFSGDQQLFFHLFTINTYPVAKRVFYLLLADQAESRPAPDSMVTLTSTFLICPRSNKIFEILIVIIVIKLRGTFIDADCNTLFS